MEKSCYLQIGPGGAGVVVRRGTLELHKLVLQHRKAQDWSQPEIVAFNVTHIASQLAVGQQPLTTLADKVTILKDSTSKHWFTFCAHVSLISALVHSSAVAPMQLAQTRLLVNTHHTESITYSFSLKLRRIRMCYIDDSPVNIFVVDFRDCK